MASTYMDDYRHRCRQERDAAIAQEIHAQDQDIYALERSKKKPPAFSDHSTISIIVGVAVGVLLCLAINFVGFLVGLAVGLGLNVFLHIGETRSVEQHNARIPAQQDARRQLCKDRCKQHEADCDRKIEAEKKKYLNAVAKARKAYGGSTQIDPLIKWVADRFEANIRAADRQPYVKQIRAEIIFRVQSYGVEIVTKMPHTGTFSVKENFDFFKNCLVLSPGFFEHVGFAQALAKRVEFECQRRFPVDPLAPAKQFKPTVTLDYNDTQMQMTYQVNNPQYKPAVNMRQGVK